MATKTKGIVVLALMSAGIFLCANGASAQGLTDTSALLSKACNAGRVLGLCANAEDEGLRPHSLSLGSWRKLRINTGSANTNKFFQLVKLFIDDLEVGQVGNMKVKLSIEIK